MSDKDANTTMRFAPSALLAALLLALPAAVPAQEDPLKSAACADALEALQKARSSGKGIEAAREHAAGICLGSTELPKRPSRVAQAPLAVPAPVIAPPATSRSPALPTAPVSPPVAIQRPATPAYCDGGGCWSDNGQHLQVLPPNLAGPNGQCVPHAGLVYCP